MTDPTQWVATMAAPIHFAVIIIIMLYPIMDQECSVYLMLVQGRRHYVSNTK